jgi:hypothetical protein
MSATALDGASTELHAGGDDAQPAAADVAAIIAAITAAVATEVRAACVDTVGSFNAAERRIAVTPTSLPPATTVGSRW